MLVICGAKSNSKSGSVSVAFAVDSQGRVLRVPAYKRHILEQLPTLLKWLGFDVDLEVSPQPDMVSHFVIRVRDADIRLAGLLYYLTAIRTLPQGLRGDRERILRGSELLIYLRRLKFINWHPSVRSADVLEKPEEFSWIERVYRSVSDSGVPSMVLGEVAGRRMLLVKVYSDEDPLDPAHYVLAIEPPKHAEELMAVFNRTFGLRLESMRRPARRILNIPPRSLRLQLEHMDAMRGLVMLSTLFGLAYIISSGFYLPVENEALVLATEVAKGIDLSRDAELKVRILSSQRFWSHVCEVLRRKYRYILFDEEAKSRILREIKRLCLSEPTGLITYLL